VRLDRHCRLVLELWRYTLANRLKQNWGRSAVELIAADFGDDYRVVRSVRETTPEAAALLIKTQRPLQFLLNYELYPRSSISIRSVPLRFRLFRKLGWTSGVLAGSSKFQIQKPLQFKLAPREASF
jgi:hypothetical protein